MGVSLRIFSYLADPGEMGHAFCHIDFPFYVLKYDNIHHVHQRYMVFSFKVKKQIHHKNRSERSLCGQLISSFVFLSRGPWDSGLLT